MLILLLVACGIDSNIKRVPAAPAVTIIAPAMGEVLRLGNEPFTASALVSDSYSLVADLEVTWNLDGVLAAGVVTASGEREGQASWDMPLDEADLGSHHLEVVVVDEDGSSSSSQVDFTLLGPVEPPTVTITRPDDGATFALGEEITFQGEAFDSTTPAADLVIAWSADGNPLSGAITSEGMSVLLTVLDPGVHTVLLAATDADGDVGADSITVTVVDEAVEAEPGDLVFSEMMVDPEVVEDEVGEWVELYNTSGYTIDISGYAFHDDDVDTYTLEGPALVAPGDYVVLCANMDTSTNGGVPCDIGFFRDSSGAGLALANGPDELVLSRPDGVEIDWLHYDETWYVIGAAIGVDPSYQDGGNNDDASHWCVQRTVVSTGGEAGTPGQDNDRCE